MWMPFARLVREAAGKAWHQGFSALDGILTRPWLIRDHLLLLVAATILPLLLFGTFALWRVADAERSRYEQQLRHAASDLATDIDRAIEGMIVTLRTLATSDNLRQGDLATFHAQASAALAGSPFGAIVMDAGLRPLANTRVAYGTPLPSSGDRETPARVLETKEPQVSNLFIGTLTRRPFLNVGVPVHVDGEVRYVLLMTFAPDYIQTILRGQNLPADWVTGVSDAHGMVIARSVDHDRYVNTPLPAELFKRRRDSAIFRTMNLDGLPVLRAVAPIRHADWTTAATMPLHVAEAVGRRAYLTLGLFGLVALALSLAAATALARILSRAVLDLQYASRAIAAGGPLTLKPTPLAEAATVQAALREAMRARRAVEEELRLTSERLALAARIGGIASATVTYDDAGAPEAEISDELGSLLGLPGGPLASDLISALVHPEDRDEVIAKFTAATGPGGSGLFQSEHRLQKADGAVAWLNVRSSTFFEGSGNTRRPRLTVVAVRDITARKQIQDALLANEARYRSALLVGRIASWETNLVTRQRFWTPEGIDLFQIPPNPIGRVGGPDDEYYNALHPDDRHLVAEFHRRAETVDAFAAEYRIRHPDGRTLWVSGRGQVVERTADGKPVRLINVVADITERKLAEEALKTSEARFRMLAEAIPNIAWTAAPGGTLQWYSPRFAQFTGVEPLVPDGRDWPSAIHPDDLPATRSAWQSAVASGSPYEIEHRIRAKDGTYRWFLSRAVPIRDDAGTLIAWVGTATNIDEIKSTEARLARYVAAADAAHDGLITISLEGQIETWNAGAERLFGYTQAEAVGRSTRLLLPEDGWPAHRDMIDTCARGGTVGPIDVTRRHKDGHSVDVAISMTPVRDERGTVIAVAKVAHDISQRMEAERRQRLLNHELSHRVKNTFAVLQAVMRSTLRNSANLAAFDAAFTGRMLSMASAHDILTSSEWEKAELGALAKSQLAAHAAADRIKMTGPRIELPANLAVPMGLLLHELATNAIKYGSLSTPAGHVALSWTLVEHDDERVVEITWRELNGPATSEPSHRGFGSVLIEKSIPEAKVTRSFGPDGHVCRIRLRLLAHALPEQPGPEAA